MIAVRVACNKSNAGGVLPLDPPCPYVDLDVDPNRALDLQITRQLGPLGWSFNGPDQQFCPRHNPALMGIPLVLSREYIEPLPGLRLRLEHGAISRGGAEVRIEMLLDKDRYDVEGLQPGGSWCAKPAGTRWPVQITCESCHDRGYVPDFSQGLDAAYGEPGKKPCPDCQSTQT